MELLVLGIIVAINFIVIKLKFDRKRYEDGLFDVMLLLVIMALFSGSYAGLAVGSIASLFISLFFLKSPPAFFSGPTGFFQEFKRRASRGGV